jgi:hypothetical protein
MVGTLALCPPYDFYEFSPSSFRGDAPASSPGIHNHDREYGFRARAWSLPSGRKAGPGGRVPE